MKDSKWCEECQEEVLVDEDGYCIPCLELAESYAIAEYYDGYEGEE